MVFFLLTTYTCTWIPIRVTFLPISSSPARAAALADATIDFLFLLGALVAVRFAYFDSVSKLLVTNRQMVAKRYYRSSLLWFNVVAAFPAFILDMKRFVDGAGFPSAVLLLRLLRAVNYKSQWR